MKSACVGVLSIIELLCIVLHNYRITEGPLLSVRMVIYQSLIGVFSRSYLKNLITEPVGVVCNLYCMSLNSNIYEKGAAQT